VHAPELVPAVLVTRAVELELNFQSPTQDPAPGIWNFWPWLWKPLCYLYNLLALQTKAVFPNRGAAAPYSAIFNAQDAATS